MALHCPLPAHETIRWGDAKRVSSLVNKSHHTLQREDQHRRVREGSSKEMSKPKGHIKFHRCTLSTLRKLIGLLMELSPICLSAAVNAPHSLWERDGLDAEHSCPDADVCSCLSALKKKRVLFHGWLA